MGRDGVGAAGAGVDAAAGGGASVGADVGAVGQVVGTFVKADGAGAVGARGAGALAWGTASALGCCDCVGRSVVVRPSIIAWQLASPRFTSTSA